MEQTTKPFDGHIIDVYDRSTRKRIMIYSVGKILVECKMIDHSIGLGYHKHYILKNKVP